MLTTPRRIFPPAPIQLTPAAWQHASDVWAMAWFAALASGDLRRAAEFKAASEFCARHGETSR